MKILRSVLSLLLSFGLFACVPLGYVRYRPETTPSRADRVGFNVVSLPITPLGSEEPADFLSHTAWFDDYETFAAWYETTIATLEGDALDDFVDAYRHYGEQYFDLHGLAFVSFFETSGSIRPAIWRTYLSDDGILSVLIEELRPLSGMTDDMRSHAYAFEFDRNVEVTEIMLVFPDPA